MKGLFLYVTAGKGHQVPAEALRDAMRESGNEAISADLFDFLHLPAVKKLVEKSWRNMLHHPSEERVSDRLVDTKLNAFIISKLSTSYAEMKVAFLEQMEKEKPDFILGTHSFIGSIIVPLVQECQMKVPVFVYAPDIFFYPNVGINKDIDRLYVASDLGFEWCLKQGFSQKMLAICPFPLKHSIEVYTPLSKLEARKKLGLEDRFTILLNLGGEGIGNTKLVRLLAKQKFDCQVIVVGRMSKDTAKRYLHFRDTRPFFHLYTPGFVDNMNDYISASDVQVGKAGANSLMESLFLKRPFIITEQLYPSERTSLFFNRYHVGWIENFVEKQVVLLKQYRDDPTVQKDVEDAFKALPLSFGSRPFVKQVMLDAENWKQYYR